MGGLTVGLDADIRYHIKTRRKKMKKGELLKHIQALPDDLEICVFDHRQNAWNCDADGSPIGIHLKFEIEVIEDADRPFVGLSFDNDDYDENGFPDLGSSMATYIETETR